MVDLLSSLDSSRIIQSASYKLALLQLRYSPEFKKRQAVVSLPHWLPSIGSAVCDFSILDVEAELNDVAVLYDVFFALDAKFSGIACCGL